MNWRREVNRGPFPQDFAEDDEGVVRREMVTYRKVTDGSREMIVKETVTRSYFSDDDYVDSKTTLALD